jgi:cell fate (sporulation/competence/biofilm development) regulator YlbF (YheA/YmcA/DUF963 family)
MELIWEKAREVGRMIAQSTEYAEFKRASARLADDREAVTRLNRLDELQESLMGALQSGAEPPEADIEERDRLAGEVQQMGAYQAFESSRANLDRLMMRVNEEIAKGVEAGEQSRIILPS